MKHIMVVFGTRPEAIKMAPVIKELRRDRSLRATVCVTSQHRHMLDQVLSLFAITPDIDLDLMQPDQTLESLTARAFSAVTPVLREHRPDCVLVQGDTTTAMTVALAAFYQKIPVGHVEAGLRTHDIYNPFPEEINRRVISAVATYHFAPTTTAYRHLVRENKRSGVYLTGNTVVDALRMIVKSKKKIVSSWMPHADRKLILVTAHRRENFGKPLENICSALKNLVLTYPDIEIVYPVHLNPNINGPVHRMLEAVPRISLIPPVEYHELVSLMRSAYLILTDSGGIQEEAPAFGKPVLVLRSETERPEGIRAGVAKLVGTDEQRIFKETGILLTRPRRYKAMSKAVNPYGDGRASKRIVTIIKKMK
jgi:UDP-N-acetylglucosamine 2-epimerase (non-hydrolysing)